ncbi:MAG TPA: bifunctional diaminohydroxyphosphoribosylaminopyrimidine deaminase/5-amino-6-(5-phosphoribosylamino)uracil reductase RibD [Syntrophales bacterium]|nr:bifunctional diaminohydroxyphosphoribosylaminopyrimidine deaminase/5-amino-6-(5-phosphoribosylamino)uracil reductase RibD [Syntrophales bacterium]
MQKSKDRKPDEYYMKRALRLAARGAGRVSPNPMVGAVVVRDGRVVGEGFHERFGGKHAEINALERASEAARGSTVYITLEPCTHYGKTPPCVDRLIEARPARVVIGTTDPNPLVSGKGVKTLEKQGIETVVGVLEESCRALNEAYFHFMHTGRPFVTVKFAQSLDGRVATVTGNSRWISSGPSLRLAHRERSLHDAVLVGVGTVLQDDPELTVRLVRGRNPLRVILDSRLRTPLGAKVLKDQDRAKTLVVTTRLGSREKRDELHRVGLETLSLPRGRDGGVSLGRLLDELGKRGVSSLLVEGGSGVITTFLREKRAQRLLAVIAPKIIGKGVETVGDLGIEQVSNALPLYFRKVSRVGDDVVIDARVGEQD